MATKKPPVNPVSDADKDAFDLYVKVWQERLGLNDWRIVRSLKKPSKANMAEVVIHHPDRLANYRIGDDFGAELVTAQSIESMALHELLHVMLAELVNQTDYGIEGDALASAEHRVINALVKLLKGDA